MNFEHLSPHKSPIAYIMSICSIALALLFWSVPDNIKQIGIALAAQHTAQSNEHNALLKILQITCYNLADYGRDPELRAKQQRRCLTLELKDE